MFLDLTTSLSWLGYPEKAPHQLAICFVELGQPCAVRQWAAHAIGPLTRYGPQECPAEYASRLTRLTESVDDLHSDSEAKKPKLSKRIM